MDMLLFQRIELTIAVFLLFGAAVLLYAAFQRKRVRAHVQHNRLPKTIIHGEPTLLYFWTQECSQCKPQDKIIEQVQSVLQLQGQSLKVYKFNALHEQALSQQLHIVTVPTTVLVDAKGDIAAWNPGLTQTKKLIHQILTLH
jgi:thioredoxin-like negative regulator of GroEL